MPILQLPADAGAHGARRRIGSGAGLLGAAVSTACRVEVGSLSSPIWFNERLQDLQAVLHHAAGRTIWVQMSWARLSKFAAASVPVAAW